VLVASAVVFAALAIAGRLGWPAAAISFGLIFLVALLIPRRVRFVEPATGVAERTGDEPDNSTRQFAEVLRDPCFIVDRRAHLRYANAAGRREFPSAEIGDPMAFTLRNPAFLQTVDQAIRTGARAEGEFLVSVPTETWYSVEVNPLWRADSADADSRLLAVMLINQTEQRRLDRMRADFVANASHELRTPLTSLIGYTDTLMGSAADDQAAREKFLRIMREQAERMSRLIDDLLSLSRIELHQHLRPTGTTDLVLLAREVAELLKPLADEAGVKIEVEAAVDKAVVTGDRGELVHVLENLVDNAIKYGAEGGRVVISIEPARDRAGTDFVVGVRDFGAGIAAENVPRLTERFYRVDAESSRRMKGTGLGLAIVKHIVTRHRGELAIASELGEGTTVSVYLSS